MTQLPEFPRITIEKQATIKKGRHDSLSLTFNLVVPHQLTSEVMVASGYTRARQKENYQEDPQLLQRNANAADAKIFAAINGYMKGNISNVSGATSQSGELESLDNVTSRSEIYEHILQGQRYVRVAVTGGAHLISFMSTVLQQGGCTVRGTENIGDLQKIGTVMPDTVPHDFQQFEKELNNSVLKKIGLGGGVRIAPKAADTGIAL